MAKMMSRKERQIRKIIGKGARLGLGVMELKEVVTSPHTYAIKKALKSASSVDKVKMRRGAYKNRVQILNPHTKRYYVRDTRTHKILYGGKRCPYKNVRMHKSRRRKRR